MHPTMRVLTGLVALSVAVLGGCEGDTGQDGLDPADLPTLQLEEELRLGVVEGREGEEFGSIRGLTLTSNDEVWLMEIRPPMLRRFAQDGTFLGTSGREGQGPGEFGAINAVEPLPDGGVLVLDSSQGRLSRFDANGAFLDAWPLPSGIGQRLRIDEAGEAVYVEARDNAARSQAMRDAAEAGGGAQGQLPEAAIIWIRLGNEMEVMDTIRTPPADRDLGGGMVFSTAAGPVVPGLSERLHVLDRQGRVIHAWNRSYTLEVQADRHADTLVQVAAQPVLKTPAERRELEERIGEDPRVDSPPSLNPEKPILAELQLDLDDRVWARLRTEAEEVDGPGFRWRETLRLWHVWEPDGTPVGVVRLELEVHWMEARGDHLWVATLGDMGEIQIIKYRMVEG